MNTIIKYEGYSRFFFIKPGQIIVVVNPYRLSFTVGGPHFNIIRDHYRRTLLALDVEGNSLWNGQIINSDKRIHPMSDFMYFFKNLEKDGAIYLEARPK